MEVIELPIDQINPAPYNPRIDLTPDDPRYKRIERSLDRWGAVEPLVWNRHNQNLVGGHQRLKILVSRKHTNVWVSVVEISDLNEEKALNIALNNSQGDNEEDKVLAILQALQSSDPVLFEDAGFDDERLLELIGDSEPPEPETDGGDVTPAPPAEFDPRPSSVIDMRQIPMQARRKHWIGRGLDAEITDPVIAELVYRWFTTDGCGVLDPWAMDETYGIVAAMMGLHYVGYTPAGDKNVERWAEVGNENLHPPDWRGPDKHPGYPNADLIFGRVPAEAWDNGSTFSTAIDALNMDRFACLIIDEPRNDQGFLIDQAAFISRAAKMAGLKMLNHVILVVTGQADSKGLNWFITRREMHTRHQHLLVFVKGSVAEALNHCSPVVFKGMDAEGE